MMFLWTAFLIGLVGSFHCAGMCGPIAVALPLHKGSIINRVGGGVVYNLGRIVTYMILGAIFGLLGKGIHLAGFQQWSAIAVGAIMILLALAPMLFGKKISIEGLLGRYSSGLIVRFQNLFRKGSWPALFGIGLLNGILPCGLVYVAIAGAINSREVIHAISYMALFGLGTLPGMLSVSFAGNFLGIKFRNIVSKMVPYIVILLGVLFILRGLSLGIPYISPKTEALTPVVEKAHKCCHK